MALALCFLKSDAQAQQISIFTESTGGDNITTADFIHNFDTTVRNDGTEHVLSGGTNIALSAGHHLVMYNSRFDSTGGGNRSEMQTNLNLNGVDLAFGWSQSYIRRGDGQDESINAGGAIIDVPVAGQILQLQTFRTDNNGGALVQREPGATGIQLLKLDDDADYLRIDAAGTNQNLPANTTNWTKVNYHNEREKDTGSFAFTASSSDITLVQQGHYLVMANTYVFESAERDGFIQRLTLDGAEVSGSRTTVYIRGNQQSCSEGAASLGMIIETTAPNQVLNVEMLQDVGRTAYIVGDKTALSIVKLPEVADYIRIVDDGAGQDINTNTALLYDDAGSQLELDPTFSHSTSANPSQVGVAADGDYLFFAQQYDSNDEVQRIFYNLGWQANGTGGHSVHGQTGRYSRNGGGADQFGNWAGFLTNLSASDYIETLTRPLGRGGSNAPTSLSLQGIRVDNVLGPDVFPPEITGEDPVDDSNNIYISTNLVLTFNEEIALTGTGTITLREDPNGTPSDTIIDLAALGGNSVSVDGKQLIIDPASSFASGAEYAVLISNDAVEDLSTEGPGGGGNAFLGIADNTTWNFTTGALDPSPPDISFTNPVDNAIGVTVDSELQVTFDDPVFRGTGNIYIYDVTSGAVQQTIDVTDDTQVRFEGNTMIITPAINLGSATEMAVQWDAAIVRNFSDIGNAALTDMTTWSFTTTQASLANPIFVYNHSFETDATDGAGYGGQNTGNGGDILAPTNWSLHVDGTQAAAETIQFSGVWNPPLADYPDTDTGAADGDNIAYITPLIADAQVGFSQIMADVHGGETYPAEYNFIHGPDYQLKVKIGDSDTYAFSGYRIQLLAGGVVLAEDVNTQTIPSGGAFIEVTLEYEFNPDNAALNGEPLEIRLLTISYPPGNGSGVDYDDVRLSYGYINPNADTGGPYVVTPIYDLNLDGSASRPSDGQTISLYEWDLNNDGVFGDIANEAQPATLTFSDLTNTHGLSLGNNTIALRVTDTANKVSVTTTNVRLELSSVTPGADFVLDAREDPDTGNSRWEDIVPGNPSGLELLLDTPAVTYDSSVTSFTQINRAYTFPGGNTGNTGGALLVTTGTPDPKSFQNAFGDWSVNDMSMEIWFRPDSLSPGHTLSTEGQIIFEDGGGSGLGFYISANQLILAQDANSPLISYDLNLDPDTRLLGPPTSEFIQAVVTRTAAGSTILYVNGYQVGTAMDDDADWSGGDPAAFGTLGGVNAGGRESPQTNTESFDGQIAIVRVYNDQILTAGEVLTNFDTVSSPDVTKPFVEYVSPDDDSIGVLTKTNLVATFDSDIQVINPGSGTVTLKNLDDGSGLSDITINITDGSQISVSGRDLIINPAADLDFGTNYAVRISNDAIEDPSNNAFDGILDDTTWNFRTVDLDSSAPVIVGMSPPDNATGVSPTGLVIEATFDDDLLIGSGNIEIYNIDGAPVLHGSAIPVGDASQVSVGQNTISITPSVPLVAGSSYSIRMDGGVSAVVTNTSYEPFEGITGDTFWNFTINAPLFTDGFETPDVDVAGSTGNTSGQVDTTKWVRATAGFGATRCGIVDEAAGAFTDPTGEQAFAFRYTNSGLTTKAGVIGSFVTGTTYTISFDVVSDSSALPYDMKLLAVPGSTTFLYYDVRSNGDASVLESRTGNAPSNGSYQTISFDYTATASDNGTDIVLRFRGATTSANIDNVSVTLASAEDTTPPDLADIDDGRSGADIEVGQTINYTVSFTEDIDAITVMANDFGNFEAAGFTVGTITESTDTSGVFTVPITPTSTGSFQLQILGGAVIKDMAGNVLDTSTAINDDVTITVIAAANAYAAWTAGPFDGTLSNTDTAVDFDGGGLATGLEWVLGGDPTLASDDNGLKPTLDASGASNITFVFRRAVAARDDTNTNIAIKYCSDMDFSTAQEAVHGEGGVTFGAVDQGGGIELVTVSIPKGGQDKMFVRLEVTVTTP